MEDAPKPDPVKDKLFESIVAAVATVPADVLQQVTAEQVTGIMTRADTPAEGQTTTGVVDTPKPPAADEAAKRAEDAAKRADFSKSVWVRTFEENTPDGKGTFKEAYTYVTFDDGLRVCVIAKIRPLCAGNCFIPGLADWQMPTPDKHIPVIDGLPTGGKFPAGERYPKPPRSGTAQSGRPSFEKDTQGKSGYRPVGFNAGRATAAVNDANFARSTYVNVSAHSDDTKQAYTYYTLGDGWRICVVGHVHPLRGRGMRVEGATWSGALPTALVTLVDQLADGGSDPGDEKNPKWT